MTRGCRTLATTTTTIVDGAVIKGMKNFTPPYSSYFGVIKGMKNFIPPYIFNDTLQKLLVTPTLK